jgi:hypothetical protein
MQKTQVINMNLTGKANGLLGAVDKNADLIGAGLTAWNKKTQLLNEISLIAGGNFHLPNVQNMIGDLFIDSEFQSGLGLLVGGWLAKSLNINPMVNKIGSIAQKGAQGVIAVVALEKVLGYSTNPNNKGMHYPQDYGAPFTQQTPDSVTENFSNAPMAPTYY